MKLTLNITYGQYNVEVKPGSGKGALEFGWLILWAIPGEDAKVGRFTSMKPTARQLRKEWKLVRKMAERFIANGPATVPPGV